mgnify:CR=1 FL=1
MLLRRFLLLSTVVSLAIGCVLFFWRLHQKNDVTLERPHSVVSMAKPLGKKMIQEVKPQLRRSATHNAAKTEGKVSSSRNPVLTLTKDGFLQLLQGLDNKNPDERIAAQRELLVLLEMIPDRRDDRNREASTKLVDVEKRMKGGK